MRTSDDGKRNIVLMNAGLAIYVGRDDIGMGEAVALAADVIDSGRAYEKMKQFVKATNTAEGRRAL